jgi:hypothetical protein
LSDWRSSSAITRCTVRGFAPVLVVSTERVVVSLALGVVLLTPLFVLLGRVGGFSPAAIGAFGWLAFGYFIVTRARAKVRIRVLGTDAALVLASLAFLVVAIGGRDEPWGHGRDQQVYADHACCSPIPETRRSSRTPPIRRMPSCCVQSEPIAAWTAISA